MNIIDLHCDTMFIIYREEYENREKVELYSNKLHVDIKKLKNSNSLAQFFALFINLEKLPQGQKPLEYCLGMLDRFHMEIQQNSQNIAFARNFKEMEENKKLGKISAFLTIEEGGAIQGRLCNLRNFYRLGVRLMTLTWNYPNEIGYPNFREDCRGKGLTDFGKQVVREMNELGMVIDVSHMSDGGFYDVAHLSSSPFIASHSNARAVKDHPRNLTDDMIKILAQKGGVMGINFCADFLGDSGITHIEDIIKHIKHIRNVGGIDVISLGTDFDGIECQLEIQNFGQMGKLTSALEREGFSTEEIEKICFKNAERVIKDVMR